MTAKLTIGMWAPRRNLWGKRHAALLHPCVLEAWQDKKHPAGRGFRQSQGDRFREDRLFSFGKPIDIML